MRLGSSAWSERRPRMSLSCLVSKMPRVQIPPEAPSTFVKISKILLSSTILDYVQTSNS